MGIIIYNVKSNEYNNYTSQILQRYNIYYSKIFVAYWFECLNILMKKMNENIYECTIKRNR